MGVDVEIVVEIVVVVGVSEVVEASDFFFFLGYPGGHVSLDGSALRRW